MKKNNKEFSSFHIEISFHQNLTPRINMKRQNYYAWSKKLGKKVTPGEGESKNHGCANRLSYLPSREITLWTCSSFRHE
jgi:hypothetical protein